MDKQESRQEEIKAVLNKQRDFFGDGGTKSFNFRSKLLKKLKKGLQRREEQIFKALKDDLQKPPFETYSTELGLIIKEINHVLKNLRHWMKPEKKRASLLHLRTTARIFRQPYGNVLIMAPWNYPLQLALVPLVDALAAGNCVMLKPSEYAPNTAKVLFELLNDELPDQVVAVVEGGKTTGELLLEQEFDFIFFTGSPRVGRIVMKKAADRLTPVCLELGGKCPCIVDDTVDAQISAKRILWGKFLNAGQTCIAPDYILVTADFKEKLIAAFKKTLKKFYGEEPRMSEDYGRIINEKHWLRLTEMLTNTEGQIICGGDYNKEDLYMAPTIVDDVTPNDVLMSEEIFGPILPVVEFVDFEQARGIIDSYNKPLAVYLFSGNKSLQKEVVNEIPFGGGCINDTAIHVASPRFPFGGLGESGMGKYHGQAGFELFSHQKTIFKKTRFFDIPLRYPPYRKKLAWIKKLFKWF